MKKTVLFICLFFFGRITGGEPSPILLQIPEPFIGVRHIPARNHEPISNFKHIGCMDDSEEKT